MLKIMKTSSIALIITAISISGGPKMEFDSLVINHGDIVEGSTSKVPAVFTVKNSGDEPLKLLSVKPSCGCTVVKFDSIIQPGQSTKIESAVNIPGYRKGSYSKYISVKSNVNDSVTRLSIKFNIFPAVDISERAIDFDSTSNKSPKSVTLSSGMSDLKVLEVKYNDGTKTVPVKFTFTKSDSVSQNNQKHFKLEMFRPENIKAGTGKITIALNHKNKPELSLTGNIH